MVPVVREGAFNPSSTSTDLEFGSLSFTSCSKNRFQSFEGFSLSEHESGINALLGMK